MRKRTDIAQRCEIVEPSECGESDREIAKAMALSLSTVRKWRRKWVKEGCSGLGSQMTTMTTKLKQPVRFQWRYLFHVVILMFLALLTLFPIFWMVQMSFRTSLTLFEMPPSWTQGWTLQNYAGILETNFQRNLANSLLISSVTTLLALLFGAPAAFAFSRYRFRRGDLMAFWILFARLALPMGFALPLFIIFLNLKLVNTFQGLILVYLTFLIPMVIWSLRPFYDGIPRDLEESAYVDGATSMQAYVRIILPLWNCDYAARHLFCTANPSLFG